VLSLDFGEQGLFMRRVIVTVAAAVLALSTVLAGPASRARQSRRVGE
jgi:hypothetical protein